MFANENEFIFQNNGTYHSIFYKHSPNMKLDAKYLSLWQDKSHDMSLSVMPLSDQAPPTRLVNYMSHSRAQ